MDIRQNILATLSYYDVFDLPLSREEVAARLINFKHLGLGRSLTEQRPGTDEVGRELDQLMLDGVINRGGSFYFLSGRNYLPPLRLKREKMARDNWRITGRMARWIRLLPYVRAVFASGSLAMRNMDELSDLDILVVVRHGRIWFARLLVTGLFSLLRMRRNAGDKIAPGKICLNHYITDKSLLIPFKSIYTAQTYANLAPIYFRDYAAAREFKRENEWVMDFVFGWNWSEEAVIKNSWLENAAKFAETILDKTLGAKLEGKAGRWQRRRIERNPATKLGGGRVVFNDNHLEFHPHSVEPEIIESYNNRLRQLGLGVLAIEKNSGIVLERAVIVDN
ncbi:MAG: hypothetical protein HY506_01215 [Candidatus Yanofskybacteria bacterium]|nr:hypothetical protein [Candidatus Yanofskybacteria bacterium]